MGDKKLKSGIFSLIAIIGFYFLVIQKISGISRAIIMGLAIASGMVVSGVLNKKA